MAKKKPPICPGCDKPMLSGQAFNGLYGCHWECTEAVAEGEARDVPKQVLDLVVGRVDAQFAKLESLIKQLDD